MDVTTRFTDGDINIWKCRKVGTMDLEELIITMLDTIEEADDDGADEVVFRFNEKLIHEVAEAYREVEDIEIY